MSCIPAQRLLSPRSRRPAACVPQEAESVTALRTRIVEAPGDAAQIPGLAAGHGGSAAFPRYVTARVCTRLAVCGCAPGLERRSNAGDLSSETNRQAGTSALAAGLLVCSEHVAFFSLGTCEQQEPGAAAPRPSVGASC